MADIDLNTTLKVRDQAKDHGRDTLDLYQVGDRYLAPNILSMAPPRYNLADEGSYWVATNPNIGATQTMQDVANFSTAFAWLAVYNKEPANGRRIYLDFAEILLFGPPVNQGIRLTIMVDTKNRKPTAGLTAATPVCTNMESNAAAPAVVYFMQSASASDNLDTASASNRVVARTWWRQASQKINDSCTVRFGSDRGFGGTGAISDAGRWTTGAPPVVIGPGHWAVLNVNCQGTTGASTNEFQMGFWAR